MTSLRWFEEFYTIVMGDITQMSRVRIFDPPLSNTVVFNQSRANDPGLYPIETGYSPFDTVLLWTQVSDKRVGYNRLRVPVQSSDQVDGQLHPDLRNHVLSAAYFYLLNGKACTSGGVPIDQFSVDPLVRMWQFRHGTKRRERVVFGP